MRKSIAARPRAFSYVRFSTPEQSKGDSLSRQVASARRYAAQHGLDLDEALTFRDLGVSAHHGRNAEVGALAVFLDAVKTELVPPGSYLLVESLDRISRQVVRKAVRTLESLVDAGITVVDLSDGGRAYNTETLDNDPFAFVMMALRFIRAHEESATKGMRVAAAYEKKREQAASSAPLAKPFTRRLPGWIRWDDETLSYIVVPDRVKTVVDMFKKADAGWGTYRIARDLVARGVEPWGGGLYWHRSYVTRILKNPAVLGTFTPHKITRDAGRRRRTPQKPIAEFWPAIVAKDLFERVNNHMAAPAAKGRHSEKAPTSIFAGVLHCARCNGLVFRTSKGEANVYLVCSRAHAHAGCKYQAVRYDDVVSALATNARAIVSDAPRGEATAALEAQIRNLDDSIFAMTEDARTLVDELTTNRSDSVRAKLRELELQIQEGRDELVRLTGRLEALSGPYVTKRLAKLQAVLTAPRTDTAAVNKALKETVERIVFNPELGQMALHWRHAPTVSRTVNFYSRHCRELSVDVAPDAA